MPTTDDSRNLVFHSVSTGEGEEIRLDWSTVVDGDDIVFIFDNNGKVTNAKRDSAEEKTKRWNEHYNATKDATGEPWRGEAIGLVFAVVIGALIGLCIFLAAVLL
jgi:hypothetical protein